MGEINSFNPEDIKLYQRDPADKRAEDLEVLAAAGGAWNSHRTPENAVQLAEMQEEAQNQIDDSLNDQIIKIVR